MGKLGRRALVLLLAALSMSVIAACGAVLGCVITAISGRWIQSLLFGTSATDPMVLGSTAIVMLLVAIIAGFVPARHAASADPNTLLRVE